MEEGISQDKFTIDGHDLWADQMIEKDMADPDEVEIILGNFGRNDIPIIVFDEFDGIRDPACKATMSETIKQLSNSPTSCTIIIVGVAQAVTDLIAEHHSIARALVQVHMPRMDIDELREIVTSRLKRTPLTIKDDALWRIGFLSSGLPFYSHALGQAAALEAIDHHQLSIDEKFVK